MKVKISNEELRRIGLENQLKWGIGGFLILDGTPVEECNCSGKGCAFYGKCYSPEEPKKIEELGLPYDSHITDKINELIRAYNSLTKQI